MKTSLREQANLIAERIRKEMNPSEILVFGSVARGVETEDSDLDLCLIFDELPDRKLEVMRAARRVSLPLYRGAMDILAYSREEWDAYLAAGSSFEVQLRQEAVSI